MRIDELHSKVVGNRARLPTNDQFVKLSWTGGEVRSSVLDNKAAYFLVYKITK